MSLRAGYWSWIRGVAAAAGVVLAAAGPAHADSVHAVSFTAASQSFWGPGKSAASLDKGGETYISLLGGKVGTGFNVDASTGTVSGSYGGDLSFEAPDVVGFGSGAFAIPVLFSGGSGSLATRFGASLDVYAFARNLDFGVFGTLTTQVSVPPFPFGNNLNTSKSFSRNLGSAQTWSGATNLDISAIEFPPDPFTLVEAGPTFKVTQGSSFNATGIQGTLVYTNRATGTTHSTAFAAGAAPIVDLDEAGWWDFSVVDLVLDNRFSTGFDGAIGGYVDVFGFSRQELTTKNFNLFDTASFGLAFDRPDIGNAFSIFADTAAAGTPTPEPGTLALCGIGLAVLVIRRRRRRRA